MDHALAHTVFEDWDEPKVVNFVMESQKKTKPFPYLIENKDDCEKALLEAVANIRVRPGWSNGRDALRMMSEVVEQGEIRVLLSDARAPNQITLELHDFI